MPHSTNKIARILFQWRVLAELFFVWALAVASRAFTNLRQSYFFQFYSFLITFFFHFRFLKIDFFIFKQNKILLNRYVYSGTRLCRLLRKTFHILDDLALCSDNNDNDMTFAGHIVYL